MVSTVPDQELILPLLLLNALEVGLEAVVCCCFSLQIRFYLTDLLGDNVRQVLQRLLDRVLSHVPPELGHVGGQVHPVGQQVLPQFVPLVFQHISQIIGNFSGNLLHEVVQLAQVV